VLCMAYGFVGAGFPEHYDRIRPIACCTSPIDILQVAKRTHRGSGNATSRPRRPLKVLCKYSSLYVSVKNVI
jgi:hypothetical protein